uniref:WKF domain-containing protein n=1 Tax=Glossina pallidipes TaxID=7398 RepID=A0A1A9ZSI0_GLOPL
MAKIETELAKKRKAKKRKLTTEEHDDEVANKSVIVEDIAEQQFEFVPIAQQQGPGRIGKKRKNSEKGEVKEKRSKFVREDDECEDVADLHEPTKDELKESEKPENTLALMTIRQKRREKHQKLLEKQEGKGAERELRRDEDYLRMWYHSRNIWKFEKLRQISIEQTMLEKLHSDIWPLALQYLAGTKGASKERLVKIANDSIEQLDKQSEKLLGESEKRILLHSTKYQRARDLLQILA